MGEIDLLIALMISSAFVRYIPTLGWRHGGYNFASGAGSPYAFVLLTWPPASRRNSPPSVDGRRIKAYFNLGIAPMRMVLRGLKLWLRAELHALRLKARRPAAYPAVPETTAAELPPQAP